MENNEKTEVTTEVGLMASYIFFLTLKPFPGMLENSGIYLMSLSISFW